MTALEIIPEGQIRVMPLSDTQTPEMDAAELYYDGPTGFVPIEKARKMERERNKLVFDWHKACHEQLILMLEIEGHRERAAKLRKDLKDSQTAVRLIAEALANISIGTSCRECGGEDQARVAKAFLEALR